MTIVDRQRRTIQLAARKLARRGVRVRIDVRRRERGIPVRGYWARRIGLLPQLARCVTMNYPPRPVVV